MPVADKFTALGAGNGFPECLQRVDVDNFNYWTTLSGVNKDAPTVTDALVKDSLVLAMELYWNTHKLIGEVSSNRTVSGATGYPRIVTNAAVSKRNSGDDSFELPPKDRVCANSAGIQKGYDGGSYEDRLISLSYDPAFVRLFLNDSFVGVAARGLNSFNPEDSFLGATANLGNFFPALVSTGGYLEGDSLGENTGDQQTEIGYSVLGGKYHLLCECIAGRTNTSAGRITTVDIANFKATSYWPSGLNIFVENSAQLDSFDVYTYPE